MEKKIIKTETEVYETNAAEIAEKLGIELKEDETIRIDEVLNLDGGDNYINIEIVKKDIDNLDDYFYLPSHEEQTKE